MANRKLRNLGNLGNLGNIIPSFLISKFTILPYTQNRKLGFKNLGKKFPSFPRFPSFSRFRPGRTKGLFLPIFYTEKTQIFFQLTGLTSSNVSFYMTKFLSKSYSLI